jgi:hypothetical protein
MSAIAASEHKNAAGKLRIMLEYTEKTRFISIGRVSIRNNPNWTSRWPYEENQ